MEVFDFISNPNWHNPENVNRFYDWATSPDIERIGEARRQLGYYDGYNGDYPASKNVDYLKGYQQGVLMRNASE